MVTSCRERLLFLLGYVFPHDVYEMVRLSELWRFTHFPPMSSQRILQNQWFSPLSNFEWRHLSHQHMDMNLVWRGRWVGPTNLVCKPQSWSGPHSSLFRQLWLARTTPNVGWRIMPIHWMFPSLSYNCYYCQERSIKQSRIRVVWLNCIGQRTLSPLGMGKRKGVRQHEKIDIITS